MSITLLLAKLVLSNNCAKSGKNTQILQLFPKKITQKVNKMKKLISILLIVVLLFSIFSLVACDIIGSGTGQGGSSNNGGTTNNGGTSIDDDNNDQSGGSLNGGGSGSTDGDQTGVNQGNGNNNDQNGNSGTEVTETRYVDLYAINDFHGQTDKIARVGGFLKEKKAQDGNTILLNSGDMFQETLESNSNYGSLLNNCMAEIGIECMTIGNHEFDWGLEKLQKLSKQTSVKFLGANIYHWSKTDGWGTYADEIAEPYYIRTLDNGLKVGIIGLIGSNQIKSISSNLVSTVGFKYPSEVVPALSQKLREEEKCDVVVVSIHNGAEYTLKDNYLDMSQYADAVFCAHSHKYELETKNGVTFIQGGSKGNYVSNVRLAVDKDGKVITKKAENIRYQSSWTEDQTIAQMVEESNASIAKIANEQITTFSGYFDSDSSMPRLVCKAIASFAKEQGYNIDCALVNQTRNSCSSGIVTYKDLFNAIPFDNIVYVAEVSGKDLLNEVKYCGFWRVTDQPILENGTYTVAVIDYVLFHQDPNRTYNFFPSAFENGKTPVALVTEQNPLLNYRDITKAYLLQQETVYASDFADSNPHTDYDKIGQSVTFADGIERARLCVNTLLNVCWAGC